MNNKNTKSVCAKIESLRHKMGFSIAEMAECLGYKKARYQGYESGRRKPPDGIIEQMKHYQKIGEEFSRNLPKRIDAAIKKLHPHGIISEASDGWD